MGERKKMITLCMICKFNAINSIFQPFFFLSVYSAICRGLSTDLYFINVASIVFFFSSFFSFLFSSVPCDLLFLCFSFDWIIGYGNGFYFFIIFICIFSSHSSFIAIVIILRNSQRNSENKIATDREIKIYELNTNAISIFHFPLEKNPDFC